MILKYLKLFFIYFLILIIKLYQFIISPILKPSCRHLPTCSEYMIIALKDHGIFYGILFSFKRLLSCHPFGNHGHDPVPKKINKDC